jgi:hypothetical protein
MSKRLSCRLSFNFVVVNLQLCGKDFSQFAKIGIHSTCGHDGFICHLDEFGFISGDDAVSFRESGITTHYDKVLSGNSYDCTSIVNVGIELISFVFNI